MTPKFLILSRFRARSVENFALESESSDDNQIIMINPRRVDYFEPVSPPNNPSQRNMYCGTKVALGSKQFIIVNETMNEIKKMLKK